MKEVQHIGGSERFSAVTIFNNVAYLAGQVSQQKEGDICEQSKDVFAKIDCLLKEIGASKDHILNAQIWLKTIADYDEMNKEWDTWVKGHKPPSRVCVEALMAQEHYLIEVMIVVAIIS
ncbi:MAG: RidA family protein [Alphaproteobacteria bacterium]